MIKVIIVDDEAIEREALHKIIERGIEQIEIVGHADNGSRAIELARELEPDLILMDIQMPGLSGLEAIRQIKEAQPKIKYVMITAYDTFDYARQALQMGVIDYLLKPSKTGVILDTIRGVVEGIEKDKRLLEHQEIELRKLQRYLPIVEADLVTQLLFDHIHEIHLDEMLKMIPSKKSCAFFVMVISVIPTDALAKIDDRDRRETAKQKDELYRCIKEQVRLTAHGWAGAMSANQIPFIIFTSSNQTYRSQAVSIVRKLIQFSHNLDSFRLFEGIGGLYHSLDDVKHSYHEALLASTNVNLPVQHHFYDAQKRHLDEKPLFVQVEKRIMEEARCGKWPIVEHELLQVISHYESVGHAVQAAQQKVFELLFVVSRLLLEMGIQAEPTDILTQQITYQQLKAQTIHWVQIATAAFNEMKNQLEPDAMHQIKQYIREHAYEDISLETIAEQVKLSSFYVSKLFKEQFGTNYIDYLTQCRLEKAKQLLADSEKSLKEIAFEVGYNDPNYFSRVFKKLTALSPSEYRKELIPKKRS